MPPKPYKLFTLSRNGLSHRAYLVVLLILILAVHLTTLRGGYRWTGDSASYLLSARNIAEGQPYNKTSYIRNPYAYHAPKTYPPGFPLMLAPVIVAFGMEPIALKAWTTFIFLFLLVVFARLLRDTLPPPYLLALIAILGLHPYFWYWKHFPMSDIAFALFLYLSLLVYGKAQTAEGKRRIVWGLLAGVCVVYTITIRPLGIVLVPTLFVYDLVRLRRLSPAFLWVTGVCAFAGLTLTLILITADTPTAVAEYAVLAKSNVFGEFGKRMISTPAKLKEIGHALRLYWNNDHNRLIRDILFFSSVPLSLLGFAHRCRKISTVELFCIFYVLALLPWSFFWDRYVIPLAPFYIYYILVGAHVIALRLSVRNLFVALLGLLVFGGTYAGNYSEPATHFPFTSHYYMRSPSAYALYDYVENHTAENEVFVTMLPRPFALFMRRPLLLPHTREQDYTLLEELERFGATYVIVGPAARSQPENRVWRLGQWVRKNPDWFELVFYMPDLRLYRIRGASFSSEVPIFDDTQR